VAILESGMRRSWWFKEQSEWSEVPEISPLIR